jgi:hypothetical protein
MFLEITHYWSKEAVWFPKVVAPLAVNQYKTRINRKRQSSITRCKLILVTKRYSSLCNRTWTHVLLTVMDVLRAGKRGVSGFCAAHATLRVLCAKAMLILPPWKYLVFVLRAGRLLNCYGKFINVQAVNVNPLTAVTSLGVKLFHVLTTTINIKDILWICRGNNQIDGYIRPWRLKG